jgi:eukaryotic-like serine/threonine-protein kinase
VPNVIGMTQEDATNTLKAAGFQVKVQTQVVTSDADDGRVLSQNPDGGTKADKGSVVTITVGKKPSP